jgi:hypothetical protein
MAFAKKVVVPTPLPSVRQYTGHFAFPTGNRVERWFYYLYGLKYGTNTLLETINYFHPKNNLLQA